LLYFDKSRDELVTVPLEIPSQQFRAIASAKGDHLLIGSNHGLLTLKVDSDHKVLDLKFDDRVANISSIVVLNNRDVFLGTRATGLYYYNFDQPEGNFEYQSNVPIKNVVDLYLDPALEELWITGDENIGLLKPSVISAVSPVGQNRIESLTGDADNNLYYSTGERLLYLNRSGNHAPVTILEVTDNYIERLYLEGSRLWIGDAFGGIFYIDLQTRQRHSVLEGDNVAIRFLYPDARGNKWFTGHSRGLIRVDDNDSVKFYPELTRSVLVRESPDGVLYCGNNGKEGFISAWDSLTDTFRPLDLNFTFAAPDNIALRDMQFDSLGNIWLATDEGLLRIANENGSYTNVETTTIDGLNPNEPVRALAIDDQNMYFANGQGLVVCRGAEYILYDQDSGLPSRILEERGLSFDREGNLMVATAKGMAVVK